MIVDSIKLFSGELARSLKRMIDKAAELTENTDPNTLLDTTTIIASFVTICGIIVFYNEYRKTKIAKSCQLAIFNDIIRHFYRDKIIILAMMLKYKKAKQANGFCYPSEHHYKKLVVLPDDLNMERFHHDEKAFKKLHELHLLMRNFNIEVEVALDHMKDPNISEETKQHDFDGLNFKCAIVTQRITEVVGVMWSGTNVNKCFFRKCAIVVKVMKAVIKQLEKMRVLSPKIDAKENTWDQIKIDSLGSIHNRVGSYDDTDISDLLKNEIEKLIDSQFGIDRYYTAVLDEEHHQEFKQMLLKDVVVECGNDKTRPEKIHIVNGAKK